MQSCSRTALLHCKPHEACRLLWPCQAALDDRAARVQVRPYLMSDGGNVEFVEIDGPVVYLRLAVRSLCCWTQWTELYAGWRTWQSLCGLSL